MMAYINYLQYALIQKKYKTNLQNICGLQGRGEKEEVIFRVCSMWIVTILC